MTEYTDEELAEILNKDIFHLISEAADELQLECYVVGGYVRDIFLDTPSEDIDCVVVGNQFTVHSAQFTVDDSVKPGIAVAKLLKKKLGRRATLSVFKNFGTAQVKISPQCTIHNSQLPVSAQFTEVEFVGARRESYSVTQGNP